MSERPSCPDVWRLHSLSPPFSASYMPVALGSHATAPDGTKKEDVRLS